MNLVKLIWKKLVHASILLNVEGKIKIQAWNMVLKQHNKFEHPNISKYIII